MSTFVDLVCCNSAIDIMDKRAAFELIHDKAYRYVYEIVRHGRFVEEKPTYSVIGARMAVVADLVLQAGLKHELKTFKTIDDANAYVYDLLQYATATRREELRVAKALLGLDPRS